MVKLHPSTRHHTQLNRSKRTDVWTLVNQILMIRVQPLRPRSDHVIDEIRYVITDVVISRVSLFSDF